MPGKRVRHPTQRPALEPRDGFVAVGYVRGAHGVRGELKTEVLTDFPQRFAAGAAVWVAGMRRVVAGAHEHKGALLVKLEGIDTRDAADALRGRLLEVPEADVPAMGAAQYFRHQIVGLAVVDAAGAPLGRVGEVLETGANDVYVVVDDEGELLVPAIDSVVKEVDLAGGRLVVEPLPGMERRRVPK